MIPETNKTFSRISPLINATTLSENRQSTALVKLRNKKKSESQRISNHSLPMNYQSLNKLFENSKTFGVSISSHPMSKTSPYVPDVLDYCFETIETNHLETVGIHRIPANMTELNNIRELLSQNRFSEIDVNSDTSWKNPKILSGTIKTFLKYLPEPLISSNIITDIKEAFFIDNHENKLISLREAINKLQNYNKFTLKRLLLHIKRIHERRDLNMMDQSNLIAIFIPNIVSVNFSNTEYLKSFITFMTDFLLFCIDYIDELFVDSTFKRQAENYLLIKTRNIDEISSVLQKKILLPGKIDSSELPEKNITNEDSNNISKDSNKISKKKRTENLKKTLSFTNIMSAFSTGKKDKVRPRINIPIRFSVDEDIQ